MSVISEMSEWYMRAIKAETQVELFRALWATEVREHHETMANAANAAEVARLRAALIAIRAAFDAALETK